MRKILWIGDGVTKTGFSTVNHNIISNLPSNEFDVHHLAINYFGDYTDTATWKLYPAVAGGDLWGFRRLPSFLQDSWDGIFILNDLWVISRYLDIIKKEIKNREIPPVIVYFPVDSLYLNEEWFVDFDIVKKAVVYTEFGYSEVTKIKPFLNPAIIGHGVNLSKFHKIELEKSEIRKQLFSGKDDLQDAFIFLNANRNQPRKKINITLEAFKLFSEGKPENVKLYCHMGVSDMGWNVLHLSRRLGIDKRLILTSLNPSVQQVSDERLNLIYNGCDVGLNTSTGEGWGLVSHEHATTGAPQIVPNHSACKELFEDVGLLVPIGRYEVNPETLTVGGVVYPEDVASNMELIYKDKDLYQSLSEKTLAKFSSREYDWEYIVNNKWIPLFREVF